MNPKMIQRLKNTLVAVWALLLLVAVFIAADYSYRSHGLLQRSLESESGQEPRAFRGGDEWDLYFKTLPRHDSE